MARVYTIVPGRVQVDALPPDHPATPILEFLEDRGSGTVEEIAEGVGMDSPTVVSILSALMRQGVVRRERVDEGGGAEDDLLPPIDLLDVGDDL